MRSCGRRLLGGAAADHGTGKIRFDFRRSDDRIPRGLRRSARTLQHSSGPDDDGKDYRRRFAGGSLWRGGRDYESGGAAGADVPGGHTLRQSAGDGGGMRDGDASARSQRGDLSAAGKIERATGGGRGGGGERGWRGAVPQPRGIDVYMVLYGWAGDRLGFSFEVRHGSVW